MSRVSEKPGRHQTSMGAMVGAMSILVVCVLGFVLLRDLGRQSAETSPEPVVWEIAVEAAHDSGHPVVHPGELPRGWTATSISFEPTEPPTWGMGMLTGTGSFVGIRQEDAPARDLLETYVDEDARQGDDVAVTGELAGEWQSWTDSGGDVALLLQRDEDVVLVYGSATREVVEELAGQLTDAPPQ